MKRSRLLIFLTALVPIYPWSKEVALKESEGIFQWIGPSKVICCITSGQERNLECLRVNLA